MSSFLTLMPPIGPLNAVVDLPASKSIANRAAVLQALMPNLQVIGGGKSEDTQIVQDFLARYEDLHLLDRGVVPLQMAGTAARFLTALACVLPGTVTLEGSARLTERPLKALIEALQSAGAPIECLNVPGSLPIRITGDPHWQPGRLVLHQPESSQMLSALLLLGPHWDIGTRIEVEGAVPSESYTHLTLQVLDQIGIHWKNKGNTYVLTEKPGLTRKQTFTVESDWSSACYWLAWLRLLGGEITLQGLLPPADALGHRGSLATSAQPDALAAKHLLPGVSPQVVAEGLHWKAPQPLPHSAFNLDCALFPDQAQTFAVLAAMALNDSTLSGLHTLPTKETQRIESTAQELEKLGCYVESGESHLFIRPNVLQFDGIVKTYHDHRMALAFSLMAKPLGFIRIEEPEVVRKSYPHYWGHLTEAGFLIET